MSEENVVENEDLYEYQEEQPAKEEPSKEAPVVEDEEGDQTPSYEVEARSEGWRPLDEWEGDPDDWVDAKEFNFRGQLMKRIRQQSSELSNIKKENEDVKNALRALGEHNKKIAEQEYKRALKDLRQRKLDALENDEHQTVLDIDDQIDDLEKAHSELEEELQTSSKEKNNQPEEQLPAPVKEWLDSDQNKWYHEDPIMRGAADTVYVQYLDQNPNDFVGALEYVEKTMRKRFPEEMGVQKKPTKTAVTETGGRASAQKRQGKGKKFTARDLSDEQRSVAQTFVRQGVFKDVQEYVDQLADMGELG